MININTSKIVTSFLEVKNYLNKHPGLYPEEEEQQVLYYLNHLLDERIYFKEGMRELFDELGLIPEEKNIYIKINEMIHQAFDLDKKNIIEVGGGKIPRLSKRILETSNGSKITVYDPRLSTYEKDTDRMILVRDKFTKKTIVDETDLLIGFMPCKGAEALIDSAIDNKKDFFVGLCEGGPHGDYFDFYECEEEWIDTMILAASNGLERNGMGKLKIKRIENYDYNYPIIYNEKIKRKYV